MKRILIILFICNNMFCGLFASGSQEEKLDFGEESIYASVAAELGKEEVTKEEKLIIDATYLCYSTKLKGDWNQETFVGKAVELCKNDIAIAAARASLYTQKIFKTIIVVGEDLVSVINQLIESGNEEFTRRHEITP